MNAEVQSWKDLNERLVRQIQHFFVSYNEVLGKKFELQGMDDSDAAWRAIEHAIRH